MKLSFSTILFAFSASLLLASCGKSKKQETAAVLPEPAAAHSWYYFADGNFKKVEKPGLAPEVLFKPWTEATRISSASCQSTAVSETGSNGEVSVPKGFAVVNRAGILVFTDDKIELFRDSEFFGKTTAENIVFYNNTPVFSVYRSTFFNDFASKNLMMHPFLVQFNTDQNVCYPIVNIENLGLSENCEITDYVWDGQFWTCSVKDTGDEKIQFSYLTFQPKEPLTSIYPTTAEKSLFIRETSMDSFRNIRKPENFSRAPDRAKKLLSTLPENLDFTATVYTASGHSPRTFIHSKSNAEDISVKVTVLLNETWCAALFNDGTLFMNGALFDKYILKSGKNIGLKLPKLTEGFVYSDFVISGTKLYAGWEESSFFQTARSGFLQVDLNQLLYQK